MIRFSNADGPYGHFIWAHRKTNRIRFHTFIQKLDPEPTLLIDQDRQRIVIERYVDSDFARNLHDDMYCVVQNFWFDKRRIAVVRDGSLLGRSRDLIIMICTDKGIRFEVSFGNIDLVAKGAYELAEQFNSEIARILEAYKWY